MADRLVIDGLDLDGRGHHVIAEGTSLGELITDLGGSVAVEQVADEDREHKLPEDTATFIAGYGYEDPPAALAVFRSYGWLDAEEFDTAAEARAYLEGGEDWGSLAGEAIVDGDEIKVWD